MSAPVDPGMNYTHPQNTLVAYNTDGSTWVQIADLIKVQGPGIKYKKSASDNLSSTALTSTPGWRDEDEFTLDVYMVASVVTTLLGLQANKTYCNWRVQWPLILAQSNHSTLSWSGYILEWMPSAQERASDEKIKYTIKGNGAQGTPTFTAGS